MMVQFPTTMRLWSLHPSHLDAKGLVALWREGLLARAVLSGKTRGYRHHPQLNRFRYFASPVAMLDCYLSFVFDEARARGYRFDASKIMYNRRCRNGIEVTSGQIEHEWQHLLAKLALRDPDKWRLEVEKTPEANECFVVVPGSIAEWERA